MKVMECDTDGSQLQIRFVTKHEQYSVPDAPFAVPANVNTDQLNILLNELRKENSNDDSVVKIEFDFIVAHELLRTSLEEHIKERNVSPEGIITVEYVERLPAPQPEDCLMHDDWVSAVHVSENWILTGCYDNTLHIWTTKGKHNLTIPGHTAPVKAVSWISVDDSMATFVSASHDQSAMLWEWNIANNAVECVHICRGHERGVECVGVDPEHMRFATGGWDTMLKVWSTSIHSTADTDDGESSRKKRKRESNAAQIRTPQMTLKGHREAISGLCWRSNTEIVTSSWDHTLRIWDVQGGGLAGEIHGNKSFFDVHVSPVTGLLITASADRHVRLYDPRSKEGTLIKGSYSSHTQWVQTVRWSPVNENLFISGAYDNVVKLWDSRSCKVPLYDLMGHEDKVLCSDWTLHKRIVSGSSDNTLRIFKTKEDLHK